MTTPIKQSIKIKNIAKLLVAIWIGLCIYTGLSQISAWLTSLNYNNQFWDYLEFGTVRIWLPWVVMTPVVLWLAIRFPVTPKNWLKALFLHSFFLLALSLISGLGTSLHYHFFADMSHGMDRYQPWQHIGHFLFGDNVFLFNTIIYTILVANLNIRNFAQKAHHEALIASQLHSKLMETQLQALKMQINPHFLFNTLNVISVLVMKSEQAKANEMINRLSKFFRQTLEEHDSQWVPLKKEIEHIEQYLGIEQVRFGERLSINIHCPTNCHLIKLPSMLLQPIVENAMQHGLGEKQGQGTLSIRCQQNESMLVISIEDDGVGCDFNGTEFSQGIGISNVKSRLEQLYHGQAKCEWVKNLSGGVTATLYLPITLPEAHKPEVKNEH